MTVDPDRAAERIDYEGNTFYFCSRSCAEKFRQDPIRYVDSESGPAADAKPATKSAVAPGEYTCPMHPEVHQPEAGACPKCGMALDPREVSAEAANPELTDMKRRFWISVVLSPMLAFMVLQLLPGQPWLHWLST